MNDSFTSKPGEKLFMSADVMQLPSVAASDDSTGNVDDQQPFGPVICYRDPADVRTIRRQSRNHHSLPACYCGAILGVVYKSIQRPDRIVVDMSSGRTVMINDREFGATEAVRRERQASNRGYGLRGKGVP